MNEPIVGEEFEYRGFKCAVIFQPMGFRCGYVRIPKEREFFGTDYDNIPVDVHGGLTYGRNYLIGVERANEDAWWIGWDYGHYGDGTDFISYHNYYHEEFPLAFMSNGECYSKDDVKEDCEWIVNQLLTFG